MPFALTSLAGLRAAGFDAIIDVRSPAEFAEDRVPGAVNMPVLSNAERADVGTIYTQQSPFTARKIGAALVARNAATAIETHLMDKGGGWRPLVYCWRGGQRSGAFAAILAQIGWRVEVLQGGYQSWRRHVVASLYDATLPHRLIRLDGLTGTGKTRVLHALAELGTPTLDLEGLAHHRGSILGDVDGPQPAQKGFESALHAALCALDPARPVLVEAESARIGDLRLPPALWAAMKGSPRIVLEAPLEARAAFLARDYATLATAPARLAPRLAALTPLVGRARTDHWQTLAEAGSHTALARDLIETHYDPAYRRSRRKDPGPTLTRLALSDLTNDSFAKAAETLETYIATTAAQVQTA